MRGSMKRINNLRTQIDSIRTDKNSRPFEKWRKIGDWILADLKQTLRANIRETPVVPLINEQGEKEKGRHEWHFSWCSFLGGFGWRGTERRRAKRAAAQWSGSQSGRRLPAGLAS